MDELLQNLKITAAKCTSPGAEKALLPRVFFNGRIAESVVNKAIENSNHVQRKGVFISVKVTLFALMIGYTG